MEIHPAVAPGEPPGAKMQSNRARVARALIGALSGPRVPSMIPTQRPARHPIRNDDDHARALEQIDDLWGAEPGTPEGDSLEVLVTLADDYESKHHAIDPPDPIEAIKFRMEQEGLTRKDLEPMVGGRARVSEVLNRKRPLSLAMVRRLRDGLGISADVLVGGG
jgi:HTH-type transcriptional regulator / antitoxin HigA